MAATRIFSSYIVVNGVSLGIAACYVDPEDLFALLDDPPTVGENVRIPGVNGRTGYGKDQDELHVTLPVHLNGRYNVTNDTWNSNPAQGLIATRTYLRNNLGTGNLQTGDGTSVLSWHQPDGTTVVSTDAQVLGLIGWKKDGIFAHTTLDLIIAAGAFTGAAFDGIVDGAAIDGGVL
jgi:hypothetical protein